MTDRPHHRLASTASLAALAAFTALATVAGADAAGLPFTSPGNPIIADGSYYTADPAPIVVGGKLYIITGHDEAPPNVANFVMNEWLMLSTTDAALKKWTLEGPIARPETVFQWAAPGGAWASQIVRGVDHRYYMYSPVVQKDPTIQNSFAIGVAVSDKPTGPFVDAHPSGPIVSSTVPENNPLLNIDPTVLVDGQKVYLYWGSGSQMRGIELAKDMKTTIGAEFSTPAPKGYFEGPWLMKRNGTYYLLYAANHYDPAGAECTQAYYHACIAYATSTAPQGPWTYQGVILKPVSSTTSHPGVAFFKNKYYLTYHTADAEGGGHFRRSVAIDELSFDDRTNPPKIKPVVPTVRPAPAPAPTRNRALRAASFASNEPIPGQYWLKSINDGKVPAAALPPDIWGTWNGEQNQAEPWIEYRWPGLMTLNGSKMTLWADQPAGSAIGVPPPTSWEIQYWNNGWVPVPNPSGYATTPFTTVETTFSPIRTRCIRARFKASTDGVRTGGVGVLEWEILGPTAIAPGKPPVKKPAACG